MMTICCVVISLLLGGSPPAHTLLDARQWWNFRSLQAPDERSYVVLLFSARDEEKVKPLLGELRQLDKRPDVLVVGLSPDRPERVKTFIDKHKIKFLVGAGSRACLRLGGRRLPRLLLLRPGPNATPADTRPMFPGTPNGLKKLESLLKLKAESGKKRRAAPVPDADSLNEKTPIAQLRAVALASDNKWSRRRALELLRGKLAPEPFMNLCDEVLMAPPPPLAAKFSTAVKLLLRAQWYGHVAYLRHLANPDVKEKQPFLSPGDGVTLDMDPVDLALFEVYKGALRKKSATELTDAYLDRLEGDPFAPLGMLIRREIISNLSALDDQGQVLEALMTLAPEEPDVSLRWTLVCTIAYVCDRDNSEHSDVIAFLEDMLETETDIRRVRPTIVATLEHLYAGEK